MTSLLTVGSVVLAIINIGVMWAMAHHWRWAWHCNLGLQLLWLPYDTLTRQYGLLTLGATLACVSLKACFHSGVANRHGAPRSQAQHRRPRRRVSRHRHAVLREPHGHARARREERRDERWVRRAAGWLRRVAGIAAHLHQDRPAPELAPDDARELTRVAEALAQRCPEDEPLPVRWEEDRQPAMADWRHGDG